MKKTVDLPLIEPLYSTYQNQGPGSAVIMSNPSIQNWYFNQICVLTCTRRFLHGFTSPEIGIVDSLWVNNPYLDKKIYYLRFMKGCVHRIIRNLLDDGYYICFTGVDDYYVKGKSWYHERHFKHDGCICGYNQENKTYCIYSYDKNWVYRKFWTTQKSFDTGMKAVFKIGEYNNLYGIKAKNDKVAFSPEIALSKIKEYLDSTLDKYPETEDGVVYGIVVHRYISKYIDKLYEGSIPYEKMDRRVLRMIWEHKKVMLERIRLIEQELSLDTEISDAYVAVVKDTDAARMLYASHHMRRRDASLPVISKKLIWIEERERELLTALLEKSKGATQK